MKINIVILSANSIHILMCDTVYDNLFDYIFVYSLLLTPPGVYYLVHSPAGPKPDKRGGLASGASRP